MAMDSTMYVLQVNDELLKVDDWTLWNTESECDQAGSVVWYRKCLRATRMIRSKLIKFVLLDLTPFTQNIEKHIVISGLRRMVSSVCGLVPWKKTVLRYLIGEVYSQPLNSFWYKTEARDQSVWLKIDKIESRFLNQRTDDSMFVGCLKKNFVQKMHLPWNRWFQTSS